MAKPLKAKPKATCLVVEPEWGWRNLLESILIDAGIEVISVTTEAEALKALKDKEAKQIKVVLCQAPPQGAKHSLVSKIRSAKHTTDMPVICTSPSSGLQDRAQAFEHGGTDYLVRPVAPMTLIERTLFWSARSHRPF